MRTRRGARTEGAPPLVRASTFFGALIALLVVASGLVLVLAREHSPTSATLAGLVTITGLVLMLSATAAPDSARTRSMSTLRLIAIGVTAVATAWPGYFFGTHSVLAGLLALVIGVVALRVGRTAAGWICYVGIAGGQAVVTALVVADALPDRAVAPILTPGHPDWHILVVHVGLQGVYLAAFWFGTTLHRSHGILTAQIEDATRAQVARAALLAEARADYADALERGRHGVLTGVTVSGYRLAELVGRTERGEIYVGHPGDDPTGASVMLRVRAPTRAEQAATPPLLELDGIVDDAATALDPPTATTSHRSRTDPVAPPSSATIGSRELARDDRPVATRSSMPVELISATFDARSVSAAWQGAYDVRLHGQHLLAVVLCVAGIIELSLVAGPSFTRTVGWICMSGVALAVLGHRWIQRAHPTWPSYWLWWIAAFCGTGTIYAFGLHSGIIAVVPPLLLVGGVFRATLPASVRDQRRRVLDALCGAHAAVFGAIVAGWLPDAGLMPVLQPERGSWEPFVVHAFVQSTYVAAFAAGVAIDRALVALVATAQRLAATATTQVEQLTAARRDLERALVGQGVGIFSGTSLAGYELGELLGRGGMGEVYMARRNDGPQVAFKVVRRDSVGSAAILTRFADEAEALVRIESEHVARVLDVGRLSDGFPFLAMEFVDGPSLALLLRQRTRLSPDEVAVLIADVAAGLRDIHSAAVVHLDLKPSNLIRAAAHWKMCDFGVARLLAGSPVAPTAVGGTPQYMAPEQAAGRRVDTRADLYALCVVAYRALTGRPAFTLADPTGSARTLAGDPRGFVPVHEDVSLALRLGLAADPGDRYSSADELAEAFATAFAGHLSPALRARARVILAASPWSR